MCVAMAFAIDGVVRGCHIYLSAEIDSELPCSPEPGNHKDQYAITHAHSYIEILT